MANTAHLCVPRRQVGGASWGGRCEGASEGPWKGDVRNVGGGRGECRQNPEGDSCDLLTSVDTTKTKWGKKPG